MSRVHSLQSTVGKIYFTLARNLNLIHNHTPLGWCNDSTGIALGFGKRGYGSNTASYETPQLIVANYPLLT